MSIFFTFSLLTASASAREPDPTPDAARATHDEAVRAIVEEELARAQRALSPTAAVVVVLDARSGRIVATAGRLAGRSTPALARDRAWVTGSTLKTLTLAAALEAGAVAPDTMVDCAPRTYPEGELYDWKVFGRLAVRDALVVSSNVGASRVLDALGLPPLVASYRRLRLFDARGAWPTVTDARGIAAAMLASGELAETSPLRLAAAYAALFDDGRYRPPSEAGDGAPEVVFSAATATTVLAILEDAVSGPLGTGAAARVTGHRVAGKTGTADLADGHSWASFVGALVDVEPRLVILVGLEGVPGGTGGKSAAPVFARIAARTAELARRP